MAGAALVLDCPPLTVAATWDADPDELDPQAVTTSTARAQTRLVSRSFERCILVPFDQAAELPETGLGRELALLGCSLQRSSPFLRLGLLSQKGIQMQI
jgi:hypothetical protein